MKGGKEPQGFTVVEVLITIAVSGALFLSAALAVSGQIAKTEYSQAIRDIETKLTDVANDVSTGYFPNLGGGSTKKCELVSGVPTFSNVAATQGGSPDCIFIGKAIRFEAKDVGTDPAGQLYIYSLVGRRLNGPDPDDPEVANLDEANIQVVKQAGVVDLTEVYSMKLGMKVVSVTVSEAGTNAIIAPSPSLSTIAFITSFGGADNNTTSSPITNIRAVKDTALSTVGFATIEPTLENAANYKVPNDAGIRICVQKDGKQSLLVLGARNRKLTVETTIGSCS